MRKLRYLLCFLSITFTLKTQAQIGEKYVGRASYYADKFHGRMTSSGEAYNREEYTAAHRSLPFNTILEVTNKNNNKKVVVKINDRGPFVYSRVIDLSHAAARDLDLVADGEAEIEMTVLAMDNPAYSLVKGEFNREFRQHKPIKLEMKDGKMTIDTSATLPPPAQTLIAASTPIGSKVLEMPDIRLSEKSTNDTTNRHQYIRVIKDANGNYKVITNEAPTLANPDSSLTLTSKAATTTTEKSASETPLSIVVDLTMKKAPAAKNEPLTASQKDTKSKTTHTYLQVVKDAEGRIRVVDSASNK